MEWGCGCACGSEGAWRINDWLTRTPTPYILTHTLHPHPHPHSKPSPTPIPSFHTLTPHPHPLILSMKWSVDEMLCRRSVVSTKCRVDEMPCRRNAVSTKCCVDENFSTKYFSTKYLVDEVLCRRKFFDKNLSTICLSTNFFRPTTYLPTILYTYIWLVFA
jgi:hypothetical protein